MINQAVNIQSEEKDANKLDDDAVVSKDSHEYAVELEDVSVFFRSYKRRPTTIKEAILRMVRERTLTHYSTFQALKNINLEIPRGKVFGIIGSNGAGKSTLLKTITGVLPPTTGHVRTYGELDSLIQLGAGFDAELNAIENIYLNRSLYGLNRAEIKERIPDILQFAELEEFADTPIKYYSSGMAARLGFAVAIDRSPDILVVDEVLAVGDERFNDKCMNEFYSLLEQQKTIILVSHGLEQVARLCDSVALLAAGEIVFVGPAAEAIELYRDASYQTRLSE